MRKKDIKVSVKLRPTDNRTGWHLFLEATTIIVNGKKVRKRWNINRVITTPVWDTSRPTRSNSGQKTYLPKRDSNNIIMCRSLIDKESCAYAEKLRRHYQSELDRQVAMTDEERRIAALTDASKRDFIAYVKELIKQRHQCSSNSIVVNWRRVVELLKMFAEGKELLIRDINLRTLDQFKNFLMTAPRGGGKKGTLSRNSAATYFSIVKAALKQCFVDGLIPVDIAAKSKGIPEEEVNVEFLTKEEVNQLANTPCENEVLKRASLFSILTGARHSDIMKLRWREIIDDADTPRWAFRQKKTRNAINIPLSAQAREMCGERGDDDALVFDGLTPPSWISRPLSKWVKSAGITKHITFHCFRHTYATLQIANGTNIYIVSKMLGHTNVRTTQRYADILDRSRIDATKAITINY